MRPEDKKYMWWGLLGIGVAALFYFLSASKNSSNAQSVTVPYLVPQTMGTGASPTTDTSLSTQPNIIGASNQSAVPNYTNPYGSGANPWESPGGYGFMPNLMVSPPNGPFNNVQSGFFNNQNGATVPMSISTPDSSGSGVQSNPFGATVPH